MVRPSNHNRKTEHSRIYRYKLRTCVDYEATAGDYFCCFCHLLKKLTHSPVLAVGSKGLLISCTPFSLSILQEFKTSSARL